MAYNIKFEMADGTHVMHYDVVFSDEYQVPEGAVSVSFWLAIS